VKRALASLPSHRSASVLRAAVTVALLVATAPGCKKSEPPPPVTSSDTTTAAAPAPAVSSSASVVAESLPRCRVDGARLAVPGDDVVAGDAVTTSDALLVGVVRRVSGRRVSSVVRASLDLATVKAIDVGATLGDDPPPSPRLRGSTVFVASYARSGAGAGADAGASASASAGDAGAAGASTRSLEIARLDGTALVREGAVVQQADESLAYDVAWPDGANAAPPLVAWDEDAPLLAGQLIADRGVVKVQIVGAGKPRVASPDASDAEAPRLLARRGGYWLAWLARRAEPGDDAGAAAAEGPGERRAYRWVELVALDAKGEATSPVRRVTPEKGRVASFDLATAPSSNAGAGGDPKLVIVVQDEAAVAEGAGERIVRYSVDGAKDRIESGEVLDGGVGHALADLLPAAGDGSGARATRWLSFTDTQEHAHLAPLGVSLALAGAPTLEPSLDGTRIVASGPAADVVYAVGPAGGVQAGVELRRLVCR